MLKTFVNVYLLNEVFLKLLKSPENLTFLANLLVLSGIFKEFFLTFI